MGVKMYEAHLDTGIITRIYGTNQIMEFDNI